MSILRLLVPCCVIAACSIPAKEAIDGGPVSDGGGGAGDDGSGSDTPTAPMLTVTGKPDALGNQKDVTFTFSCDQPAAVVECRLDQDAFDLCAPPSKTFTNVPDGSHTFELRATANGLVTTLPAYAFQIDTMPPALTITSQPVAISPVATAQFQFTAEDGATLTCQLDTQAAAPCMSSVMYTGLSDGSHTFTLKATDGAGNVATKMYTWSIDTSTPSLAFTSTPPNPSTSSAAQFQFTTGGVTQVTCQLDSAAPASCTNSASYTGLADGSHTFTLKGMNMAGTTSTKTYTWTIDTMPPAASISSGPAANTNATSATFVFTTGADATMVTCQLDSQAAAACSGSKSYSGLGDGGHTFTLRASDAAGNTATKTYAWTVDTMPPALSIQSKPAMLVNTATATFSFTASGATTVTCQLDSAAPISCNMTASYSGLADGSHTFTLRGTDAAGNSASTSYTWTVDTTPPALSIQSGPASLSNSTSATFTFDAGDSVMGSVTCQLDGQNAAACSSPYSYSGLGQNSHTFTLRGTDAAGNTGMVSYQWSVDSVPPTVNIYSGPPAKSNVRTATLLYTVSDGSVTCLLGLTPVSCSSSSANLSGLADGPQTFYLGSTDAAGNSAGASYSWNVDATAPSISGLGYSCDPSGLVTASWSMSDANGISSGTCSYAGMSWNCTSSTSIQFYVSGASNPFTVSYTDTYGNTASKSVTVKSLTCM